jgi:signal transduction histidine kinase
MLTDGHRAVEPAGENFLLHASSPLLQLLPFPAALWSHDRRACVYNDNTRRLLGITDSDFSASTFLVQWMDRIHPQDRDKLNTAWRRIESGEKISSCRYRFFLKTEDAEIQMQEFLFSASAAMDPSQAVWSLYVQDPSAGGELLERSQVQDLVDGFTHELGNCLQAIRGEVDLLKIAGALPQNSVGAIYRGVEDIRTLAGEVHEYLSPVSAEVRWEETTTAIQEVVQRHLPQLARRGIAVSAAFKGPLPRLPLGSEFREALGRVIEFSAALLPQGGALSVEAGLQHIGDSPYVELRVINESPTRLDIEENDVFRPYLKVNDCCVGLTLTLAREILRRHFGNIMFHKDQRNHGVFSILIKVPMAAPMA